MSPIKDPSIYPENWKEISRRIRFERAKGNCECEGECGHDHHGRCERWHDQPLRLRYTPDGLPVWSRVVLTVAHLDHTPENCADDNLKAMCQRCHLAYDAPRKRAERRARETEGMEPLFGEVS